jgi:hypothetical protein
MAGLSFVTLLAFDYRYAPAAIRSYYDIADEIILGLDADRLSWARQPFEIDLSEVRQFIAGIDAGKKIRIVEGNFHAHEHPMANDVAERGELSRHCAPGNWVVQIDCDEMLLNAADFRRWMQSADPAIGVGARWISVFKTFGDAVLIIDPAVEMTPVATQLRGQYTLARWTGQQYVESPLLVLHYSWGRTPAELRQKLQNWSHDRDFDVEAFYRMWESVTLENYRECKNFHPLNGPLWPGLKAATLKRAPAGS